MLQSLFLTWFFLLVVTFPSIVALNDLHVTLPGIAVYKCCPENHLLYGQYLDHCRHINDTESMPWSPQFYDNKGCATTANIVYRVVAGIPDCGSQERQPVYQYTDSTDRLVLRLDGWLRHYTHISPHDEDEHGCINPALSSPLSFDHRPGSYCLDTAVIGNVERHTAIVCVPVVASSWDADKVLRRIVDPVLRGVAICCFLAVAIVYFILPPLRDLVGNILSTISISLLVSQVASLVRMFTEFSNHVSFIVADVVMYFSIMAAFFWLSSLGYYIWKMFRSRNIFLRVSDKRKYCYYSSCAWGTTLVMTFVALLAHFLFDADKGFPISPHDQQTIGWCGIAVFFTPVAFSILLDIFFYLSTARIVSGKPTYGHIQRKIKFSFQLFLQMFLVMTTAWLFLLLSWLQYDSMVIANIVVNGLQAPLILVICVISRKRVRELLSKTYCQGNIETHWGEEMMSMTSG